MKSSTEAVKKMAEVMVAQMKRVELGGEGMRELLREVGAQALGQHLEQQDEEVREGLTVCKRGRGMEYRFKRPATILSVSGRVRYRRRYHSCAVCQRGHSPLDSHMGIAAGQVTAGLAELLAGVKVAFEEATRWLEH